MSTFGFVAMIIGIFFASGVVVGFLAVMAIPSLMSYLAFRQQQSRLDPTDQLDTGPPVPGPGRLEPDDRDIPPSPPDSPWWRGS